MSKLTTAAIMAILALAVLPAMASASAQDTASTHAYIRANYEFTRASVALTSHVQSEIHAFNGKLARQCPKIGVGSPQNEISQHISDEVVVALWSISYGTDSKAIHKFVSAVKGLRWSKSKLTHIAQGYAKSLEELAKLPMPNICEDVSSWKASGFKVIPASTLQLDRKAEAIEAKSIPAKLLAPYERPTDKAALTTTIHLEAKLQRSETETGFNDWDVLLGTLGLNQ